jgi:hypothetical protein
MSGRTEHCATHRNTEREMKTAFALGWLLLGVALASPLRGQPLALQPALTPAHASETPVDDGASDMRFASAGRPITPDPKKLKLLWKCLRGNFVMPRVMNFFGFDLQQWQQQVNMYAFRQQVYYLNLQFQDWRRLQMQQFVLSGPSYGSIGSEHSHHISGYLTSSDEQPNKKEVEELGEANLEPVVEELVDLASSDEQWEETREEPQNLMLRNEAVDLVEVLSVGTSHFDRMKGIEVRVREASLLTRKGHVVLGSLWRHRLDENTPSSVLMDMIRTDWDSVQWLLLQSKLVRPPEFLLEPNALEHVIEKYKIVGESSRDIEEQAIKKMADVLSQVNIEIEHGWVEADIRIGFGQQRTFSRKFFLSMIPINEHDVSGILRELVSSGKRRNILVLSGTHGACNGINGFDQLKGIKVDDRIFDSDMFDQDSYSVAMLRDKAKKLGVTIKVIDAKITTQTQFLESVEWATDIVGGFCFGVNGGIAGLAAKNTIMRALLGLNVMAHQPPLNKCAAFNLLFHTNFVLSQSSRNRLLPVFESPVLTTEVEKGPTIVELEEVDSVNQGPTIVELEDDEMGPKKK